MLRIGDFVQLKPDTSRAAIGPDKLPAGAIGIVKHLAGQVIYEPNEPNAGLEFYHIDFGDYIIEPFYSAELTFIASGELS